MRSMGWANEDCEPYTAATAQLCIKKDNVLDKWGCANQKMLQMRIRLEKGYLQQDQVSKTVSTLCRPDATFVRI